jgi:hypothetical protein
VVAPWPHAPCPTEVSGRPRTDPTRDSMVSVDHLVRACHPSCLFCGICRSRGPRSARCLPSWKHAGTTAVRQPAPRTSSGGPRPFGSPRPAHVLTSLGETTFGLRKPPRDPLVSLAARPGAEYEPRAEVIDERQDHHGDDGDAGGQGKLFTRPVIVGSRLVRTATSSYFQGKPRSEP